VSFLINVRTMVEFLGIRPPSQFPAERRAQIAESVRRDPELSDREHRRRIGVDHRRWRLFADRSRHGTAWGAGGVRPRSKASVITVTTWSATDAVIGGPALAANAAVAARRPPHDENGGNNSREPVA